MNDKEIFQKLVFGISHDLGAPLRSVVRFSEMLQGKLADRMDEREARWFKFVVDGGKQAQSMLEALLKYSRLATKSGEKRELDLNDLVQHLLVELKARHDLVAETCIHIDPLPKMYAHYSHMEVLFHSLLENAVLFHKKDSRTRSVSLRYKMHDTTHEFTFEDNGLGVANSHLGQITQPFWRGYSAEAYPGLGMGLAYCERVVQLCDGEIVFKQREKEGEKGLQVKVILPVK